MMAKHLMYTNGSTHGAATGRYRAWVPGDEIDAPEGEFRHLPDSHYETRPMKPKAEPEKDLSDYHVGGGWYEVRGEKVQGKDAARKLLAE